MRQLSLRGSESYTERPGVPDCIYYMRTGFCGYGDRCRYNHPGNRAVVQSPSVPITEQYGGTSTSVRVARPPILHGSYVQGSYGLVLFSPEMVPIPSWSHYSAPVSPVHSPGVQPAVGATSLYGLTQLSSSTPSLAGPYPSLPSSIDHSSSNQNNQTFPERPGELECQYYLRTGDCKFGPSCRYHHPRDRVVPQTNCILSPMGLSSRPKGHCKFGSTSKFDHPMGTMRYSPSTSTLIDMPVAPYPSGSLLATLAPSSTSSSALISGSKKDSYLSRIPSSASTSSTSVGSIFSQTGSVPLSDMQLSSQSSVPLSSTRRTRQGECQNHSSLSLPMWFNQP
ncbi:hypothetical protein V6N12_059019 [Hibiscus sabdariffa]|uniref:C3H1-type domain-containing protein n=1 Tax=Hibiscus sabdariffa TaxID=183260 RepID=A0ABR2EWP1_9ROSI